MIKKMLLLWVMVMCSSIVWSQPQYDSTIVYVDYTPIPLVVDGSDSDSCWSAVAWHSIDKVWIPYGATITSGDFEGFYKAAWDSDFLYLLVKVVDDSLADYYTDPLSNWWNDDCVEIFLDEDRSKGYHECSYNAFAYHVSMFYDAIDMSTTCGGINLKNNLKVVIDTIAPHTYLWEFAIKVYNGTFNPSNPEKSRVKLIPGKRMGFAIAYCDYDGNSKHERENFIGSIFMPAAHNNDNYRTADYLGEMILVDSQHQWHGDTLNLANPHFEKIFFTYSAVSNKLVINYFSEKSALLHVYDMSGKLILTGRISQEHSRISLPDLRAGLYMVCLIDGQSTMLGKFVKQY